MKSEIRNSFGKRSHCTEDKTQNSVFRSDAAPNKSTQRVFETGHRKEYKGKIGVTDLERLDLNRSNNGHWSLGEARHPLLRDLCELVFKNSLRPPVYVAFECAAAKRNRPLQEMAG